MLFPLPPAPPAIVVMSSPQHEVGAATTLAPWQTASDCKRGSRDCFPTDRVGQTPDDAGANTVDALTVTRLIPSRQGS
ncbi:MAG: hypothetical protein RLZZ597_1382 [Cyanobacteriota bacterium]|jgi:hypothetical protein